MKNLNQKLRIAFILDAWYPFVGGGQVYAKELKHQLEENYNCAITLYYPPHHYILIRLIWSLYIWLYIVYKHRTDKYDIIHSQGYNSGAVGKICSIILRAPIVHTVHGSNLIDQAKSNIKARLEKWLLTQINYDSLITVSRSFLKYPNNSHKTYHISNGVDVQKFAQVKSNKSPNPSLLWIGRDDSVKNKPMFDRVVKLVRKDIPDLITIEINNGQFSHDQLIKYYHQAWIYVQTSKSEGFSLTVLEAMAAGLPVVATAVGENSNLIKHQINGFLVNPDQDIAMAEYINTLISDRNLRQVQGKTNSDLVKKKYSWQKVASQTYKVYGSTIKS